ncbi:MAG: ribonuclease R [Silanimonas sp.]|nr:MAG: ribonuclease R [Silanimonas sp.]
MPPAASAPGTKRPRSYDPFGRDAPAPQQAGAAPPVDPFASREARRYEHPIVSREAILAHLRAAPGPMTAEDLAAAFGLSAPDRFEALSKRLAAMVRDGQLLLNRRGGFAPAEQLDLIPGRVVANPDGFGFLKPEDGSDDLFLPPNELRKAMHGDRVLGSITGVDRRGRREGVIVEVLERRLTRVIGRFEERAGIGYVVPDDRRILSEVLIPPLARHGAKEGQRVVAEITAPPEPGRPPFGRILVVLGDRLTASRVVEAAIHTHDLPHEFPPEVLQEAEAVPLEVPPEAALARTDLRALPLVTIDGEDAKDFDDAVWCEADTRGFRLIVAIADVSAYVRPGTALDAEAVRRGTSVYFPGYVVPMLPETLSNGICSLNPKVDRLCFVCDMRIDFDGRVTRSRFYEAVMRSHARLTYTTVGKAIDGDAEAIAQLGELRPRIEALHQLYRVLAKARRERGAIEFESGEVRFVLDARGEVIQAGMLERNDAHKLIEECMIAANVEAAKFVIRKKIPAPFRIHDRPPERKYTELLEFLAEFGLRLPPWEKVQPKDFTALLRKVRKRPDAALLETVLLRSQSLAQYSIDNIGHFGLALESYGHFTSPIRRYPDLLLHRAIKHVLGGGTAADFAYTAKEMGALCLACSEKERRADEAEREVDERYRSAWMEQHVGSDFDGVVSGVTSFGLFVELTESKVNGLVHVTMLPHDYYHFDATRKTLSGERRGLAWSLGDTVRVKVLRASVEDRRIDFKLVLPESVDTPRKGGTPVARPHPNARTPRGGGIPAPSRKGGKGAAKRRR